jgi:hypothetical protein
MRDAISKTFKLFSLFLFFSTIAILPEAKQLTDQCLEVGQFCLVSLFPPDAQRV